jgi:Vacuolar sorting 38 and autophagy-related subunit 14
MISCSHCHETAAHCSSCVARALRNAHERRRVAWNQWHEARQECRQYFEEQQPQNNNNNNQSSQTARQQQQQPNAVLELQAQSDALRHTLEERRKLCSEWAVRVCELQVANEERQQQLVGSNRNHTTGRNMDSLQRTMQSLQDSIIDGLDDQLNLSRNMVRHLRWQWALTCFKVYRLQVDETNIAKMMSHSNKNDTTNTSQQQPGGTGSSSGSMGIGKICGLPLPNAGSELLGVLPRSELQSALRHTASLTQMVAQCLAISLPHPIRLRSETVSTDIIPAMHGTSSSLLTDDSRIYSTNKPNVTSSQSPRHENGPAAIRAKNTTAASTLQRIQLATTAWIHEAPSSSTASAAIDSTYVLGGDCKTEEFQIAWQFLQHDILNLCIRAGVPVAQLSSGEAVLCNLYALQLHCQTQLMAPSSSSLPMPGENPDIAS